MAININVRVLIGTTEDGFKTANRFSDIYSKMFYVDYVKERIVFDDLILLAEEKGMTHMLYFLNDKEARLSLIQGEMGGYTFDIGVDDLEKVLSENA